MHGMPFIAQSRGDSEHWRREKVDVEDRRVARVTSTSFDLLRLVLTSMARGPVRPDGL